MTSIGTVAAALFVSGSNADCVKRSAREMSQHVLLATVVQLKGAEIISTIDECGSIVPVAAMSCRQEVSAAAGNASIAIASAAATSLERTVITEMIVLHLKSIRCDGDHRCGWSRSHFGNHGHAGENTINWSVSQNA